MGNGKFRNFPTVLSFCVSFYCITSAFPIPTQTEVCAVSIEAYCVCVYRFANFITNLFKQKYTLNSGKPWKCLRNKHLISHTSYEFNRLASHFSSVFDTQKLIKDMIWNDVWPEYKNILYDLFERFTTEVRQLMGSVVATGSEMQNILYKPL